MNVITLSNRAFNRLEPLALSKHVLHTESTMLKFNHHGDQEVIKKLFYQDGELFANKLYTLEMLSTNKDKLPRSFLVPSSLICVSGIIQGFSSPFMDGINFEEMLNDDRVSLEEKKYFLKKVGEILSQMKAIREHTDLKDFFLCDMHASNFIVNPNNKDLGVCDLDSMKIAGNKSSHSRFLNEFSLINKVEGKYKTHANQNGDIAYVTADENSDLYCYMMMILSFLYGSSAVNSFELGKFYDYLNYLEYIGVNKDLVHEFASLVSNKDNVNPSYLVDSLNMEQVCRANYKVYEKVKNNVRRTK